MALVYLGYKLLDISEIKFKNADNCIEKCVATFSRYKMEQSLLSIELGIYMILLRPYIKKPIVIRELYKYPCCDNYRNNYRQDIYLYSSLLAFPISIYRTYKYINNNDQKIISFNN